MSAEAPLDVLVDQVNGLASKVHESCSNASAEFDRAIRDIDRLRSTLQKVADEVSKPDFKIRDVGKAECDKLAFDLAAIRCQLLLIDGLAAKDQGLKKKRIWKRDRDSTAALDMFHHQVASHIQIMSSWLSKWQNALLLKEVERIVAEMNRGNRKLPHTTNVGSREPEAEADEGWSMIRRELAADGITDVDFEAHKSSIKALLRERLPPYYESHFAPGAQGVNDSVGPSGVSRSGTSLRGSGSEPATLLKRDKSSDEKSRASRAHIDDASSKRISSQAMFYIDESTDSEPESSPHTTKRLPSGSSSRPSNGGAATKMSGPQRHCIEFQCSLCRQVFPEKTALMAHENEPYIWSCSLVTGDEAAFFDSSDAFLLMVCGLCGETFDTSSEMDSARRRKHLSDIHKWDTCDQDTNFYLADYFRLHLKEAHHAVPGWWFDRLLRCARRDCHGRDITDAPIHPPPGRNDRSLSHLSSLAPHLEENDGIQDDIVRRSSSNMSRANSMHRIHSDISEYDAQGSLIRRTITDSYTSLKDAAAAPLERHQSSPGQQPHARHHPPSVGPPVISARSTRAGEPVPVQSASSTMIEFCCPFCPIPFKCPTAALLKRHIFKLHADILVPDSRTRQYDNLKRAYMKRKEQLRQALQLLDHDEMGPPGDAANSAMDPYWVTQTLRDLDLDSPYSSSDSDENPIPPKVLSPGEGKDSPNDHMGDGEVVGPPALNSNQAHDSAHG